MIHAKGGYKDKPLYTRLCDVESNAQCRKGNRLHGGTIHAEGGVKGPTVYCGYVCTLTLHMQPFPMVIASYLTNTTCCVCRVCGVGEWKELKRPVLKGGGGDAVGWWCGGGALCVASLSHLSPSHHLPLSNMGAPFRLCTVCVRSIPLPL